MKTIKKARLTETGGRQPCRLLVLVPHPEIRRKMRLWSAELFCAGLAGAWAFPHVAPLAVLTESLNPAELKQCAALLRIANTGAANGKISGGAPGFSAFPCGDSPCAAGGAYAKLAVYGPELDIHIPYAALSEIIGAAPQWFSPPALGAALVNEADRAMGEAVCRVQPPAIAFRAAALATMVIKPLQPEGSHAGSDYSYAWKIGSLHWLPRQNAQNAAAKNISHTGQ